MQVGNQISPNSRSVGQRIKEASLKENVQHSNNSAANNSNGTVLAHSSTHNPTDGVINCSASSANYSPNSIRVCRSTAAYASEHASNKRPATPNVYTETQRNIFRVIGQYLSDLGMRDTLTPNRSFSRDMMVYLKRIFYLPETADSLVEESGCRIESPLCSRLHEYVLHGIWSKALGVVEKLKSSISEKQYLTARVLLLEEKFNGLLANGELLHALRLLQIEYPKNKEFKERSELLASILMSSPTRDSPSIYKTDEKLKEKGALNNFGDSSASNTRNQAILMALQKILPPNFLLPPKRLEELLKQSFLYQTTNCHLHISSNDENIDGNAILKNHECPNGSFPSSTTQILDKHCAQVWCLEFSPCGQYLASGAKDNCVFVWQVESPQRINFYRRLQVPVHIDGISSMSWSSDSQFLAVASTEDMTTGIFLFNVSKGTLIKEYKPTEGNSFSVVSFFGNSSHRFTCGDQKGNFHCHNLDSNDEDPKVFDGYRIRCLYGMKDGKTVLAADTHNRIRSYDFETNEETTLISESSQIMYFSVSNSEKYVLVTTKNEGLHLWCLKTRCLIRAFIGSSHDKFVVSSTFGGHNSNFIASGSEDNLLVIWNINQTQPIRRLTGHTGVVNAASWNPLYHNMIATGSDDGTIRIWSSHQ